MIFPVSVTKQLVSPGTFSYMEGNIVFMAILASIVPMIPYCLFTMGVISASIGVGSELSKSLSV